MKIKTLNAVALVLDWNLWPRHESHGLDSTNLSRMKEALRADVTLPPIVVNESDLRVVDGFHRVQANLDVFGDDARMRVNLKSFEKDSDMFLESARLNAVQGLPLSPKDKAHVILRARRFHIPIEQLATALGMSAESMRAFFDNRSATAPSGETIVLSGGAKRLAQTQLTDVQMPHVNNADGLYAEHKIYALTRALNARDIHFTEKTCEALRELSELIDTILQEVAE